MGMQLIEGGAHSAKVERSFVFRCLRTDAALRRTREQRGQVEVDQRD